MLSRRSTTCVPRRTPSSRPTISVWSAPAAPTSRAWTTSPRSTPTCRPPVGRGRAFQDPLAERGGDRPLLQGGAAGGDPPRLPRLQERDDGLRSPRARLDLELRVNKPSNDPDDPNPEGLGIYAQASTAFRRTRCGSASAPCGGRRSVVLASGRPGRAGSQERLRSHQAAVARVQTRGTPDSRRRLVAQAPTEQIRPQ